MMEVSDLLMGVYVAVGIVLLIVLYHVLFVVVNLRKILRRIEGLTAEVEAVILKPLSMVDVILEWVVGQIEKTSVLEKGKKKK